MRKNTRTTGTEYEGLAADYLTSCGYRILERNFRCRQGEIDLIAQEGEWIVFIEVKFRSSSASGDPSEAVNVRKQRRISHAAAYYLFSRGLSFETPCRFDVVAILPGEIRLIRNAFEYIE